MAYRSPKGPSATDGMALFRHNGTNIYRWYPAHYATHPVFGAQLIPAASASDPALPFVQDDFEDVSTIFTGGTPAEFTRTNAAAYSGQYGQSHAGLTHASLLSTMTLANTDLPLYTAFVRPDTGGGLAGIAFNASSSSVGYSVLVDPRNGAGSSAPLQIRRNNSTTTVATGTGYALTYGTWYRLEVGIDAANRIDAKVFLATGTTPVMSVSIVHTVLTSGSFGPYSYGPAAVDLFKAYKRVGQVPAGSVPDVPIQIY